MTLSRQGARWKEGTFPLSIAHPDARSAALLLANLSGSCFFGPGLALAGAGPGGWAASARQVRAKCAPSARQVRAECAPSALEVGALCARSVRQVRILLRRGRQVRGLCGACVNQV